MLIAILIPVCLLVFLSLLNLGEAILIRKMILGNRITRLPRVKPQIIQTFSIELSRIIKTGKIEEDAQRWIEEFYMEQPWLAEFLKTQSVSKIDPSVSCIAMYKFLKAQAEADSLADLTKIQK